MTRTPASPWGTGLVPSLPGSQGLSRDLGGGAGSQPHRRPLLTWAQLPSARLGSRPGRVLPPEPAGTAPGRVPLAQFNCASVIAILFWEEGDQTELGGDSAYFLSGKRNRNKSKIRFPSAALDWGAGGSGQSPATDPSAQSRAPSCPELRLRSGREERPQALPRRFSRRAGLGCSGGGSETRCAPCPGPRGPQRAGTASLECSSQAKNCKHRHVKAPHKGSSCIMTGRVAQWLSVGPGTGRSGFDSPSGLRPGLRAPSQ